MMMDDHSLKDVLIQVWFDVVMYVGMAKFRSKVSRVAPRRIARSYPDCHVSIYLGLNRSTRWDGR